MDFTNNLRPELRDIPMPRGVAKLPVDRRGYPVPWFVQWIDGEPEFRIADSRKTALALRQSRCWVCGGIVMGKRAYLVGPMCAVNRTSAEPPSHIDCARYAAKACPFMARPHMRRRENGLPEVDTSPGISIRRNPGVGMVWIIGNQVEVKHDHKGDLLFHLGVPTSVEWYAEGRAATRDEVMFSIESGLPILTEMATEDGPEALQELDSLVAAAMRLVPA
jgi:hypothetical protein